MPVWIAWPNNSAAPLMPDTETGDGWDIYADQQTPTPEETAVLADTRRCIERTLAGLGPIERAMIVLRDVEDRSYQEIAEHLTLGLSAVKMRIHRARLAFAQLIESICPDTWRGREPAAAIAAPRKEP
jgi:RNA polymerase sigma-70 factor (ECF subfamily)